MHRVAFWGILVAIAFIGVSFLTPFWGNLFFILVEPQYRIPEESSIFEFWAIELGPGSADYWAIGEDRRYYYFRWDMAGILYRAFPKAKLSECPSFDLKSPGTWCEEFTVDRKRYRS